MLALAAPANADDGGFLHRIAADLAARFEALRAARVPTLVPPVPVAIHWRPQKLGSLDLGAPLVALAAADLDGDGRGELYAITPREVIAIGFTDKRPRELGRVAFAGELAVSAPRDVVGAAVVDGHALIASVSSYARGLRVTWHGKTLVGDPGELGFELCAGRPIVQLSPGDDFFRDHAVDFYGVRCSKALVDSQGHPLAIRAQLSTGNRLDISIEHCNAAGADCGHVSELAYTGVGVAFEIADLDRDGTPEVIFAGAGAPGDPDELRVVTIGDDEKKTKLRKGFKAGGVAGIAVTDLDGDGAPEVLAAVRLVGSTRVDLWMRN